MRIMSVLFPNTSKYSYNRSSQLLNIHHSLYPELQFPRLICLDDATILNHQSIEYSRVDLDIDC